MNGQPGVNGTAGDPGRKGAPGPPGAPEVPLLAESDNCDEQNTGTFRFETKNRLLLFCDGQNWRVSGTITQFFSDNVSTLPFVLH